MIRTLNRNENEAIIDVPCGFDGEIVTRNLFILTDKKLKFKALHISHKKMSYSKQVSELS